MKKFKNKQHILDSFMNRTKEHREIMAHNAGFNSAKEFKAHLEKGIKKDSKNKKHESIHNVHILDISYSMVRGKLSNAIIGINSEISELKRDDTIDYYQTIVKFSGSGYIITDVNKQPISKVKTFNAKPRGMTALNDAIGLTLEKLVKNYEPGQKTIVKVFTDGLENDSKTKYKKAKVLKSFIQECESKDITVAFVGTKSDVGFAIDNYGIKLSNTLVHDNTAAGVKLSFDETASATRGYAVKVKKGEAVLDGFYKQTGTLED